MSFEQTADQATPNETGDQPLSFNVGDRTFDAISATTKIEHSEAHILKLEAENAAYAKQLEQSTSIDEALAQLRVTNAEPQNSQPTEPTGSVSEEQIGEIASKQIADYLASKQVADNATAAQALAETTFKDTGDALTAIYGDKTDEAMAQKATELGISKDALYNMAKSPATAQMLLTSMQVNSAPSQSAPSGGFNSANLGVDTVEKLVDHSKPITSSTLVAALQKAGGGY